MVLDCSLESVSLECHSLRTLTLKSPRLTSLSASDIRAPRLQLLDANVRSFQPSFIDDLTSHCPALQQLLLIAHRASVTSSWGVREGATPTGTEGGDSGSDSSSSSASAEMHATVKAHPHLQYLWVAVETLVSLSLSDCPKLRMVDIADCPKLRSFSAQSLPYLVVLKFRNELLRTLTLAQCSALKVLEFSGVQRLHSVEISQADNIGVCGVILMWCYCCYFVFMFCI